MSEPQRHPTFPSLNKPLTVLGLERKLFFTALIIGTATFNFFSTLIGGIVMFALLYFVLRRLTKKDPQLLRILVNSSRFKVRYDPAKRVPYQVRRIRRG
jgi:type IV secretory pathway TrbD component